MEHNHHQTSVKEEPEISSPPTSEFEQQDTTMGLLREFCAFLGERKKFWLLPIIVILVLLGALIIFTSGTALAPFIYTIF